jgi:outer membrane biosynthesis protein TonB
MQSWSKLKKTVVISAVGLFGLAGIGALNSPQKSNIVAPPPPPPPVSTPKVQAETITQTPIQPAPTPLPPPAVMAPTPIPAPEPQPINCPNGTYVNTYGNTVCSPYEAPSAPAGATAKCVDGTYSFSQSHSGTCSHHGGVSAWL